MAEPNKVKMFDNVFKKLDLSESTDIYGFTLRVIVPRTSIFNLNTEEPWTKQNVKAILTRSRLLSSRITLILPERWLSPVEASGLITSIHLHPDIKSKKIKGVDILTQSDIILKDCLPETVLLALFTKAGEYRKCVDPNFSCFASNREEIYKVMFQKES
jgi:hypothetical protein